MCSRCARGRGGGLTVQHCGSSQLIAQVQESHADALLQHVAHSTEGQALIKLCGTPRVLGRCTFSSLIRTSYPQPDITSQSWSPSDVTRTSDIHDRAYPTTYIYYRRHKASSLRFYALGLNEAPCFDLQNEYMCSSLKHNLSSNATLLSSSITGQILVNQVCFKPLPVSLAGARLL